MVRLNYFILDGVSPLIISWQTRFGAPVDSPLFSSPLPNFSFLQRRPCKLASFHSTDVSVPIGLSLRGDVLAILWNTPNTRAWVHTHTHIHRCSHTHTRRNTQTHGVILLLSPLESMSVKTLSHLHSLTLLFLPFPVCRCSKERQKKSEEKKQNVCVCVYMCLYTQHILCDNLA